MAGRNDYTEITTVGDVLVRAASLWPERDALVFPDQRLSYVELYDRAMPEVIRIERAWPTPSTEENINEVYPAQREEAKRRHDLPIKRKE